MNTIGILGCGQLARMMTMAAIPLGIKTLSFVEITTENNGITPVFSKTWFESNAITEFCEKVDIITFETENIPLSLLEKIQKFKPCAPSFKALQISQDRILEKSFVRDLGIATAQFYKVTSLDELQEACIKLKFPCVLKTTRMGYDGKGQIILKQLEDCKNAWLTLNNSELILEEYISFSEEISLICVRNKNDQIAFYPVCLNKHKDGILYTTQAPYENSNLFSHAETIGRKILHAFNYVGVMTIEFFVHQNQLLVNEIAPRVHNSGHWTIEGAATSQFENHIRAILDLPLGATTARGYSLMLNCVGSMPERAKILNIAGAHFHSYDKAPRPNRKLGHITINQTSQRECERSLEKILEFYSI